MRRTLGERISDFLYAPPHSTAGTMLYKGDLVPAEVSPGFWNGVVDILGGHPKRRPRCIDCKRFFERNDGD